jgi:hypothetical protein
MSNMPLANFYFPFHSFPFYFLSFHYLHLIRFLLPCASFANACAFSSRCRQPTCAPPPPAGSCRPRLPAPTGLNPHLLLLPPPAPPLPDSGGLSPHLPACVASLHPHLATPCKDKEVQRPRRATFSSSTSVAGLQRARFWGLLWWSRLPASRLARLHVELKLEPVLKPCQRGSTLVSL